MRILLVSLHFVEYAVELASELSRHDTVHLVLSRRKVAQTLSGDLDRLLEGQVSYTLLDSSPLFRPRTLKNMWIVFTVWRRFRPDVLHHQESRDPSNLWFLLMSLWVPMVGTVHDVETHPGDRSDSRWVIRLRDWVRRYRYRKIIVHGESLKRDLTASIRRSPEDLFAIPHGCLFTFRTLGRLSGRDEAKEEEHTVLFFGRMQEYKGLRYLIEAEPMVSRAIPDFMAVLAGQGDDLTRYWAVLEGNPRFEIVDRFIPNEEVASFFQRAAVVVLPYVEASQSGIVAIAFTFGKPVIVTAVGGLSEAVTEGKTGRVVPPRDPGKLAEAIVDLLQDGERRRRMGKMALVAAETELSWSHAAQLTRRVYVRVLHRV
jgi:glycosyltransferase involved in cell wall biosynthesis